MVGYVKAVAICVVVGGAVAALETGPVRDAMRESHKRRLAKEARTNLYDIFIAMRRFGGEY